MGLDMYLVLRISEDDSQVDHDICYWRKANAIHGWFEKNCLSTVENGCFSEISRDKLRELVSTCLTVLENKQLAQQLLPPCRGFFFGSYEIDDYYFAQLRETVDMVKTFLEDEKLVNESIYYFPSW